MPITSRHSFKNIERRLMKKLLNEMTPEEKKNTSKKMYECLVEIWAREKGLKVVKKKDEAI